MKNLYILINPPGQSNSNWLDAKNRIKQGAKLPHELFHGRWNNDGSKYLAQGLFDDEAIAYFESKTNIYTILGEYQNGFAEQKVYDYLSANKAEWENEE